jgi:hypothetical protein
VFDVARWTSRVAALTIAAALVFAAPAMAAVLRAPAKSNGSGGGGLAPPPNTGGQAEVNATIGCITTYTDKNGVQSTQKTCGLAIPAPGTPTAIIEIINAANQIAHNPYVYGGGHGCYGPRKCSAQSRVVASSKGKPTGFDCSGSVSWALHADGLSGAEMLPSPLDSGQFETWGVKGKGNWITVYTNPAHAFVEIAGLYFDTAGPQETQSGESESETGDRWSYTDPWEFEAPQKGSYKVRHPKGW